MSATRRAPRARKTRPAETPPRAASRPPRERFLTLALAAVILAAGAWAYSNSFGGVFVLDDVRAIVRNPSIRTLWPLSVPLSPPSESTVAGRPVANLSFALSYAMGAEPAPFHAGNLFIHLAAALALFGVVRRTLLSPRLRERFEAVAPWMAFAIALLWVVHPLQTAAVTYVVQRVESLMGLLYLLTLYCAIRASEGPGRRWWAAAAVVSCAAGMGTKETMVTAPVMVALWDWLFCEPEKGRPAGIRRGLVGALAASWLLLAFLVSREFRGPSIDLSPGDGLAVRADAGRGGGALPAARALPVAAGVPLRLAARPGAALDGVAGRDADGGRRAHRDRRLETPPGLIRRRLVLPDSRALVERAADCHRGRRRTPDVPAARRCGCRHRHGRAPGCDAVHGLLDAGDGWPWRRWCCSLRRARWGP